MTTNEPPSDDEVGYGKPPKRSRFQKGTSGNPAGRPKGKKNLATVLEKDLHEKVVINEQGTRKTVTKMEAAVKQLTNKAASGDLAALRLLTALVNSAGSLTPTDPKVATTSAADRKIINRVLEKLGVLKGNNHGDNQ